MAATAAKWTSKIQMGWESTRGTAVNASRLAAEIIGGWFQPHLEKTQRSSLRGSLTNQFSPPITTKEWYTLSGLQIKPSYATLPSWLEMGIKGTAYASNINTAAYSRVYQTAGTSDDVRTASFEVGVDTQAYKLSFGCLDKFTLTMKPDAPLEMTADVTCAQSTTTTFTSVPNPPTYGDEIRGTNFLAWVDSTTIGTTQVYALEAQFEYSNNWKQLFASQGSNYPYDHYREPYDAKMSMTLRFDSTTEYEAFRANTLRKVRVKMTGPNVTGGNPAIEQSLQIDWYGYWTDAPIVEDNGIYVVKCTGTYVSDPTTRVPFAITVVNDQVNVL